MAHSAGPGWTSGARTHRCPPGNRNEFVVMEDLTQEAGDRPAGKRSLDRMLDFARNHEFGLLSSRRQDSLLYISKKETPIFRCFRISIRGLVRRSVGPSVRWLVGRSVMLS